MSNKIKIKVKKHILVAEDEKSYSRALVLKLQNSGFDAENVTDGKGVMSFIENKKTDLIVLDIMMPGMNGFEVLEELQKIGNNTPVIVLSNLNQEEDKKKCGQLGARIFLDKSSTPLSSIIENIKDMVQ